MKKNYIVLAWFFVVFTLSAATGCSANGPGTASIRAAGNHQTLAESSMQFLGEDMGIELGHAQIVSGATVEAGAFCSVEYVYTVGHPIDDTGYVKIAFRYAGDFGTPQFDQPSLPNFCAVSTDGNCRIEPRWDPIGHTRPWGKTLFLKVMSGYLNKGDQVRVIFGDTSKGSPGWRMQTFCEKSFEFKTLVDPFASYCFKELPSSPFLEIVPGKAVKKVIIAPSQVLCGEPFFYRLKDEDAWGNPVGNPEKCQHPGFFSPGIHYVEQGKDVSNPVRVLDAPVAQRPYWADFHGQTEETIGSNTIEDYFRFARDKAFLDIAGHQGNDFQVTDTFWEKVKAVSKEFTIPGQFVVFPGYEWSGNTPLGGDRNVYFLNEEGAISRSSNELLPDQISTYPISSTATALFKNLKQQSAAFPFCFAHVGGRYADLSMHDPELECAVEVHSAWGTFEWLLNDAFERGLRVGICANSDGHKGRPGASYPGAGRFGSYGGLTCVLADSLTRESIYAAMKARHFYATTGHRCLLDVSIDDGVGNRLMMGDVGSAGSAIPKLHIKVAGTAPIERVDVFNGKSKINTVRPYAVADLGRCVKVMWSGAEVRGRARMVDWGGSLTVQGNTIRNATPVQFWNPARPLSQVNKQRVEWEGVTTGGAAGCILELDKPLDGKLQIETRQGSVSAAVNSISLTPYVRQFGGVDKQIEIYRLPDNLKEKEMDITLSIDNLQSGDNPLYVRVTQVDGHVAWSSPIYMLK